MALRLEDFLNFFGPRGEGLPLKMIGGVMSNKPLRVLVVDGGKKETQPLQGKTSDEGLLFDCQRVGVAELGQTLLSPRDGGPHLVLLDRDLSGADIAKTVACIRNSEPGLLMLVLPHDDASSAEKFLLAPAGNNLAVVKGRKNPTTQSLYDALLRRQLHVELSRMALSDELTGLYNRRGFLIYGGEYMKRACRLKNDLLVFYADLDNLKQINDQFGHQEGDRALVRVAEVFKRTFRDSDITARFGGDEFTALVIDDFSNGVDTISRRLRKNMNDLAATEHRYHLSLSFGTAQYRSESQVPLEKLLGKADRALYEQKRLHHRGSAENSVVAFPEPHQERAGNRRRTKRSVWISNVELQQPPVRESKRVS
jgi:two-component system, cell cycle response regulator